MSEIGIESTPWRCRAPADASAVAATLGKDGPLTLVAEKHIQAYSAWLWTDEVGNGYFSKLPSKGWGFCWDPAASAEFILARNPSLRKNQQRRDEGMGEEKAK